MDLGIPELGVVALVLILIGLSYAYQHAQRAANNAAIGTGNGIVMRIFRAIAHAIARAIVWFLGALLAPLRALVSAGAHLFAVPAFVFTELLAFVLKVLVHARAASLHISRTIIPHAELRAQQYARSLLASVGAGVGALRAYVDRAILHSEAKAHAETASAASHLHNEIQTTSTRVLDSADAHARAGDRATQHALEGEVATDMSKQWNNVKDLVGVTGAGLAALIAANTTAISSLNSWVKDCGDPACNAGKLFNQLFGQLKNFTIEALILAMIEELLRNPKAAADMVGALTTGAFDKFESSFGHMIGV